jgi:hypothetical protein
MEYKCPLCRIQKKYDTLTELGRHLSMKHGINKRKRLKIYKKMGIEV